MENRIWAVEMWVEFAAVWEVVECALTPEAQRSKLERLRRQHPDRRYQPAVYTKSRPVRGAKG